MNRAPFRGSILLALVALIAACSGKVPTPRSPANCGDRCAVMTCPSGSTCTLDGNCNARCEPQPLPIP